MNTEKLYYQDSHMRIFPATGISCVFDGEYFRVELDRTAFYPEGGGQAADVGWINSSRVVDVQEEGERIIHFCEEPVPLGEEVKGYVEWTHRFDLMQQHTGEHIVSGLIHKTYKCHNTGFHIGADAITIDFDGVIPAEDLPELERQANEAVWMNLPVEIFTPAPEELPNVYYRRKRDLPWPVRIVEVPGYDACACCGVHVKNTGEIGLIKLLSAVKFRNGTRIEMLCGARALEYLNVSLRENLLVSRAFSAKLSETGAAAERMNQLLSDQKAKIAQLQTQSFAAVAQACAGKGDVLILREDLDPVLVRKLADMVAEGCGGVAAVFSGTEETGYSYCLVTRQGDLRQFGKEMNAALSGRGGGKPEFQQGSVKAGREMILAHFDSFLVKL